MASITAPFDAPSRAGQEFSIPLAASIHLYPGGLVARDGSGNAVPASDTAGLRVVGRNELDADNSLGLAGAINTRVTRGIFHYTNSTGDALAAADIGNLCFVESDSVVNKTGGAHKIRAGRIVDLDAAGVWVDTGAQGDLPISYALTSAQVATANGSDAGTTQTLANALKAAYNQLQADVAAILAKLS